MFARHRGMAAILAALVIGAAVIAGCGDDDNGGGGDATTKAGKPVNIAFITWAYTDYAQAEEKGLKSVVAKDGGSVKAFNANFDPQKLQKQCEDAITSGRYNAIVISPVTPDTGVPCVKAAKAAGIPVGTIEQTVGTDPAKRYDINPQVPGVVVVNTLTIDRQIEAQSAVVKAACADNNPCKAIYEMVSPSDPYSRDLIDGIKKTLPDLDVVQEFVTGFDPAAVAKAMPDLLAAHPDVNVYISGADSSALAALPAIKDAGLTGKVIPIGNGGSAQGAEAIKAGTMFGTVGNWPIQNGAFVARGLTQAVNGEKVTEPGIDGLLIDTPLVITKETVGDFKPEW